MAIIEDADKGWLSMFLIGNILCFPCPAGRMSAPHQFLFQRVVWARRLFSAELYQQPNPHHCFSTGADSAAVYSVV